MKPTRVYLVLFNTGGQLVDCFTPLGQLILYSPFPSTSSFSSSLSPEVSAYAFPTSREQDLGICLARQAMVCPVDKLVSCSSLSRWTSAAAAVWVRGCRVSGHLGVWVPTCQQMETGKHWTDEWHFPPVVRILGRRQFMLLTASWTLPGASATFI